MKRNSASQRPTSKLAGAITATGLLVIVLGACGDDTETSTGDSTGSTAGTTADTVSPTTPDTATPDTGSGFEHPTGADDVVIEIVFEGGFVPEDFAFRNLPTMLVSGDGRQFVQGPQIEIFPAPMLPNVLVSDIGEAGVQQLLDLAAEHGLLTEREYERNDMIADASDTVVRISANGETYEHRAYALGLGSSDSGEETGDRAELQAFITAATSSVPADAAPMEPETFLVRATPTTDTSGYEVEPTIVEWPVDAVSLADADDCVAIPAADVMDLFATSNQLTFFTEDDVTYQLAVKPQLPGDSC
jgi:hypothetical protein